MSENILEINNLSKYFGGLAAVSDCSLNVKRGTITGIIGPNGSGKTTFFNLIAGNLKSSSGAVTFDDENIMSPHQAYRVQTFSPPSGKIKLSRAKKAIDNFIKECFVSSGEIKEIEYPKSPSKWNCTFCPFKEDQKLCGEGIKF